MHLGDPILNLFVIQPLVFSLLDRLADRSNRISGIGSGSNDSVVNGANVFDKLGFQV